MRVKIFTPKKKLPPTRFTHRIASINWKNTIGHSTDIGKRRTNEDSYLFSTIDPTGKYIFPEVGPHSHLVMGVFDGFGGIDAVKYVKDNFLKNLIIKDNLEESISEAFRKTQEDLMVESKTNKYLGGTTACVTILKGNRLVAANIGDTRAVLCREGMYKSLSERHVVDSSAETERILKEGGKLETDPWAKTRLDGHIILSRALGPVIETVKGLSTEPFFKSVNLSDLDSFVIMATDGVWDVIRQQEAVDMVKDCSTPQEAADKLVYTATKLKHSKDNSTALVLRLNGWKNHSYTNYTALHISKNLQTTLFGFQIDLPQSLVCHLPKMTNDSLLSGLFKYFDTDSKGFITRRDIKSGLENLGCYVSYDKLDTSLLLLAPSKREKIEFKDFLEIV